MSLNLSGRPLTLQAREPAGTTGKQSPTVPVPPLRLWVPNNVTPILLPSGPIFPVGAEYSSPQNSLLNLEPVWQLGLKRVGSASSILYSGDLSGVWHFVFEATNMIHIPCKEYNLCYNCQLNYSKRQTIFLQQSNTTIRPFSNVNLSQWKPANQSIRQASKQQRSGPSLLRSLSFILVFVLF